VCLSALTFAAPSRAADPQNDQNQIQGTWLCIATLQNGKQVPNYVGVKGIMKGNKLTWIFPLPGGKQNVQDAVFELDPSQNPKHYTWYLESSPNVRHQRLYVLSGDTLLMSSPEKGGQPRPENFNAGHYFFICKRVE
jgi:uncharacterized protein (TIGR03067 family)